MATSGLITIALTMGAKESQEWFLVVGATAWWCDHFNGAANQPTPTPSLTAEASNTDEASDDNYLATSIKKQIARNPTPICRIMRRGKKFKVVISQYFMSRLLIFPPHYPHNFNPIISLIPLLTPTHECSTCSVTDCCYI